MDRPKALFNWSGGKDSSLCLHKALQDDEYEVAELFTTVNERYRRITQHGVRLELLREQAGGIGLPLRILMLPDTPTMESYNRAMAAELNEVRREGVSLSVFGDIFLEDLRQYREKRLAEAGFEARFPLWGGDTGELAQEFIGEGFRAIVVCVDDRRLDESFVGRAYDEAFLADLPEEVDPCGENGEFHTFVHDGPIFRRPVPFSVGEKVHRAYRPPSKGDGEEGEEDGYRCGDDEDSQAHMPTGFWFCDLLPVSGDEPSR